MEVACFVPKARWSFSWLSSVAHGSDERMAQLFNLRLHRLPDMGSDACLEALYPLPNGAARNGEQINAFNSRG